MTIRQKCEHPRVVRNAITEGRRVILLGYCLSCDKEVDVNLVNYRLTASEEFHRPVYEIAHPVEHI